MRFKTIWLTVAIASAFAVPASASAMAPAQPTQDLSVGPTTADSGFGTSPGAPADGAVDTPPEVGEEEGISTSPGATEPGGGEVLPPVEPADDDGTAVQKIEGHEGQGVGAATEEDCQQMAADANGAAGEVVWGLANGQYAYAAEMFAFGMDRIQTAKDRKCVVTNSDEGETEE